ncbi:GTP pyrophosphokinase [Clostridium luticellarii]|jgi:putative GTP pyrophosphokinase|uniref:GTP pyrophosphokinase YjbM n=1 Tax=Clostridium luticellarii TaxID=1691940 RepID=A0A2T0BQK1_9CLOT|nr:GTP pyrophosphokinase family protein [Clostridium luticellarii]MCI1944788.1 GTP pyrophosphokinase family protein [Clostridium luticellarii]MCI1968283.1 GTP pyrophosphokinase family protein [Clostridium luticellarii]MCI1995680.1 GTP pyrophosphokinase family protein [Clostridium luticellarii]MCI2040240.1 GTP pyrophosphokinase family protein [Clostridium luticellarii]PRR86158.1 GTP pyrophosphokinase YjbM [Clostridium luticellarii]
MAIREWKTFLLPYNQAVEELKVKFKSIRKEYRVKNEYSPIEFVTGRVKEISSILEKANKLNIPLDRIGREMEDIAGIRIMCQFVDDIGKVVNIVRKRKDMQIMYEKDYITNVKESGYRSYHMVIKYPVNMSKGEVEILAEFQIRTLAMNFWATAEHSLNYKYKHDIPDAIKFKLKSAADAAFQLDEQMLEIKDEIKDAQKLFEVKSSLVSDIMNNILTLSSMGKLAEATRYQVQLNKLTEEGEVFELVNLLRSTEKMLQIYR